MDFWIRSQNRTALTKINSIGIEYDKKLIGYGKICVKLGEYATKERALEVLDEIQSKLKATFLMKPKNDNYSKYVEDGKRYLEELNDISIVTGDRCFNLEPINSDVYVYEMPKE